MASEPRAVLSFMELVRFMMGGREYAEKRLPELLAEAVASYQNESALIALVSKWLRDNFQDPNHVSAVFFVSRLLKARESRPLFLVGETLETLTRVSDEIRELPDVKNATDLTEKRERFGAAASEKFKELFEAAKARLATRTTTGGGMPDQSPPPSAGNGWMAKLSSFFGSAGAVAGNAAQHVGAAIVTASRVISTILGAAVLYCLIVLLAALFLPTWMEAIAWISFIILIGTPTIIMIVAGFREDGVIIQVGAGLVLAFICSSLLIITFALAGVAGITTGEGSWRVVLMLPILLVVWDRIVLGITQKVMSGSFFAGMWLKAFSNDGTVDPDEKAAIQTAIRGSIGLVKTGVTVVTAGLAIWTFVLPIQMAQQPIRFELGVLLMTVHILLTVAYARLALSMWRDGDWPRHLEDIAKGWGKTFLTSAWRGWVGASLVGLVLIVGWGLFFQKDDASSTSTVDRVTNIVATGGDRALAAAETLVKKDEPKKAKKAEAEPKQSTSSTRESGKTMNCGGKEKSAAKVKNDLAKLGSEYCTPKMKTYPCNCR